MPPQQQAEHGQTERAERHQADLDFAPGELFAQHRTQCDAHREHREDQRDHRLVAVHPFLGVGRDLRQVDRADKPEPRVADNRARHRRCLPQAELQGGPGLTEDIPVQAHLGAGRRRARNAAAGQVAQHRNADDGRRDHRRVMGGRHHDPGANGAREDREERAHFHQAIAAHQLIFVQGLGHDRVFHRPEQRRVRAHGKQRQQHQLQVVEHETHRAHGHDHDLADLDHPDQRVLVELLAKLPGQGREQEERQDKQQRAEIDPDRAVALDGQLVENRQDQRLLEYIVVERTKGLGNEERQETPFAQQSELRGVAHRPCSCVA